MAFSKDQLEPNVPVGGNDKRTSADFLPRYFRTSTNQKFLGATVDQLISEGEVDKVNAYIGRRNTKSRVSTDRYLEDVSPEREAYQLEPSLVIKDTLDNVTFFKDYNDYINQIKFFNNEAVDHSLLNSQEFYAWNPHIDWDKFVNYREYYWLPNGPAPINVAGQSDLIVSTYSVSLTQEDDNTALIFSPVSNKDGAIVINEGLVRNPNLKLYRGQTYKFEIRSPNQPIAFKTARNTSDADIYRDGITKTEIDSTKELTDDWIESGIVTFQIPLNAPSVLYYVSRNDINTSGIFKIYDITEASEIDVSAEIINKKTYTTSEGVTLSNGMKVKFQGRVTPEKYKNGYWYVEGVGNRITLISEFDLETPATFSLTENIEFDSEQFDTQGFDVNSNIPATKDYITVNRGSKDRNAWSRYNRWFHRSVIETSASVNNLTVDIDQTARATRPIIEFSAGIELFRHGKQAKANIQLVDTFTTDVFSTIEGSLGYNIDGVDVAEGMRILFTADTDTRVNGRIYRVGKVKHLDITRLTLIAEADSEPVEGETVLVLQGLENKGQMFYYSNGTWNLAQNKTGINQTPRFNVFDSAGASYGDHDYYPGTNFIGTKLFSYKPGSIIDSELGFGISYKNIGNVGDLVFDFNLHTDTVTYQNGADIKTLTIDVGYLKINDGLVSTKTVNGWVTAVVDSNQSVLREYEVVDQFNFYQIDTYVKSGNLTDLSVTVYKNNVKQGISDYTLYVRDGIAYVQFFTPCVKGDIVLIETKSLAKKTDKGYYKFPVNLENNPQNSSLSNFTLSEIFNHVQTISANLSTFVGSDLGTSNLRDLGPVAEYGTKIVQHSGPLMPVIYHVTDKKFNVVNALRHARDEYSKFKRNLIRTATNYGFDGITSVHLDLILKEITKEKVKESPYYLSDMVPSGGSFTFDQTVIDNAITDYPLTFDFDLTTPSEKAVLVYLNDEILTHGYDYIFVNTNFVRILTSIKAGDDLKIVQYSSTDGCCVPPTPTKLGLYPAFKPQIFVDTTYQTPTKVIQGHDGSITVAFDDYRDDLLLEFETRIYNNIKAKYDTSLFDLHDFISGYNRTTTIERSDLNSVLQQEFLKWTNLISEDYTKHSFFDENRTNQFTFNYSDFSDPAGNPSLGYWRGIFKYFFDTDRPHTHPWEMLGMSEQPSWWETVYGPAPYTKDNLILWGDLAEGIVREPGKNIVRKSKYVRPNLLRNIPVDAEGNLVSPLECGLITDYNSTSTRKAFVFGDQAPVEAAWRRSAEYPFSIITALTLLRPARLFATCFDRVRQFRDSTGQLVYKTARGNLRFSCANLVVPNTVNDSARVFTSGLVNYIANYAIVSSLSSVAEYKSNIASLQVKMASKLGGFTSKEKFRLILDSRTPLNQGNVFIPEENYDIVLNTSSPVLSINYSGVIIEKQPSGFVIKGYNKPLPEFKYFKHFVTASDPVVNIGGISESFVDWDSEKYYTKGTIVRYDQNFFRVTTAHTSTSTFEVKYFAKLATLPVTGGREIILRRNFDSTASVLHYGAELKTVQDVVDFLLGYGEYLKSVGFTFENYNSVLKTVTDWQTAAREFVFWTTQNWAAGAVISLSPAADELKFSKQYSVVDNIYDSFYEYSVLKEDGAILDPSFSSSTRIGNNFTLVPKNTADGIYHVTLNLVQKEHVLILDDVTVFNDIIYDQVQGYHQERIKVLGYRTSNWTGDFSIPGFIYDRAQVSDWKPWKDYALGETVKYKEFYYSAKSNTPGTEKFDNASWYKLPKKPVSQLLPNWDYRANQFADFYDLDSDSFDTNQQKFAQHLIGYQKRKYLENIINDDVAQYKFYQGMIREKGVQNSLSKLFDALNTANRDSLEFYEEWAIRLGQYGASAGFEEVEYLLDERKFFINPQPFELVEQIDPNLNDFVYRITPSQVYLRPDHYNHAPFPTGATPDFISTPGYVNIEDVNYVVQTKDEFANYSIANLREGDYFWTIKDKTSWNVFRFSKFASSVRAFTSSTQYIVISLVDTKDDDILVDDYIGIYNTGTDLDGIHKVVSVDWDVIVIATPDGFDTETLTSAASQRVTLFKFAPQRIGSIDEVSTLYSASKKDGELVWVDNTNGNWRVWKFNKSFGMLITESTNNAGYGMATAVNNANDIMAVSMFDKVFYYTRFDTNFKWQYKDQLTNYVPLYHYNLVSNYENFNIRQTQTVSNFTYGINGGPTQTTPVAGVNVQGKTLRVNPYDPYFAQLSAGSKIELNINYVITNNLNETYEQNEVVTIYGPASQPTVETGLTRISVVTNNSFGWNMSMDSTGDMLVVSAPAYSDLSYSANTGFVAFYKKNKFDTYLPANVFVPEDSESDVQFGFKTKIFNNILVVASRGSNTVNSAVATYDLTTGVRLHRHALPTGIKVNDLDISSTGVLVVGTTSDHVLLINISDGGIISNLGELTTTEVETMFGTAVAITRDANTIAVGAPQTNGKHPNQGKVRIFKKTADSYVFDYDVFSPANQESEEFGTGIRFNIAGDQLVVYSQGGTQTSETTFDNKQTIFDLGTTTFSEVAEYVGLVRVFDKYGTKYVYTDDLEVNTPYPYGVYYGSQLTVTDRVYVNDPDTTRGAVYEFYSTSKGWTEYRTPSLPVDLNKIKSVFLYDTEHNNIIAYLDYIDPIKGKILGIADQEISFKTYYDPAVYSLGTDQVVVDSQMNWLADNVGRLWWDLTNAKFVYPYQNTALFKANSWNTLFEGSSVDIYEWVESEFLPSEWDALADTEEGLTLGISGTSKYGDSAYSFRQQYDNVSKTFKNVYYFWVKNKTIVPDNEGRKLSASNVSAYIADPKSQGIKYVTLLGNNQFALVNCKELIADRKVAINFRYWVIENKEINVHAHYQLIAAGDTNRNINQYVEKKWIDSLIGYDSLGNEVPDSRLPAKLKYGILSKPRQSMFINRVEALKQFIERVNSVLINKLVVDDFDLSSLSSIDPAPTASSGTYDVSVGSYAELRFVGLTGVRPAKLTAIVEKGKIVRVDIIDGGQGYGLLREKVTTGNLRWYGPTIEINGTGNGAKLVSVVNNKGTIVEVIVEKDGKDYAVGTTLTVRPFTVLVTSDETTNGKWSIYTLNARNKSWFRSRVQIFNTRRFWDYVDWYATGYNQFTRINFEVDFAYQIASLDVAIGDIVKVKNSGTQGWLLLEKFNDQDTTEVTVNYKVVGRQNGTIQFKSTLYKFSDNNVGYDGPTFDNDLYDDQPKQELRIIIDCIKDTLFVDELTVEYNNLFFASLRYAFTEQPFIDWAFKTSFVKSIHNLGTLEQKTTFQNDSLTSYEDYIDEVKPYRTKIREFVSTYDKVEQTRSMVTDFDLPARYDALTRTYKTFEVKVGEFGIEYDSNQILTSPYVNWFDNVGYSVVEIRIVDGGAGYISQPVIEIDGIATTAATATGYLSKDSVGQIIVTNPGAGYLRTPTVNILGEVGDNGRPAKAIAILGNSLVRTLKVDMKFDRTSPEYQIQSLDVTQTFADIQPRAKFALTWPMDVRLNTVTVTVAGEEILQSDYKVYNQIDTSLPYTAYKGVVEFLTPNVTIPANSTVVISYKKDVKYLNAADRIKHYYNAEVGQLGKDLGQLMTGVDYGGVSVTGINFDITAGWDALPWYTSAWDSYDSTYSDYVVKSDQNTRIFILPYAPADGEVINVYLNNVRIDDMNFNPDAPIVGNVVMASFIGDGSTQTIELPDTANFLADNTIIFRKSTSDGSFIPVEGIYDTELDGGNLAYSTARGVRPSEIIVDGDGFITPMTSHAPEEVVPGHVVDTLSINVYHRTPDGGPVVVTNHYDAVGGRVTYSMGQQPSSSAAIFVKVAGLLTDQYTVDYANETITLNSAPADGTDVVVSTLSNSGSKILDSDNFVGDGTTDEFVTGAAWHDPVSVYVTVNGVPTTVTAFETDYNYSNVNSVGFRFTTAPADGAIINYIVVADEFDAINIVQRQVIVHDGVSSSYPLTIDVGVDQPKEVASVVEVAGTVLRPSDFIYFDVAGTSRTYVVSTAKYEYNSVNLTDINVYLNGRLLTAISEYTWLSSTNELKIKRGVASTGDVVVLEIYKLSQYEIHYVNSVPELTLKDSYPAGTEITVTKITNRRTVDVERSTAMLRTPAGLEEGTVDYYSFAQVTAGRFALNRPAIAAQYVWVSLNNRLLTPNIDYVLEEGRENVRLDPNIPLADTDIVDIIVFAATGTASVQPFGYKIFKDMLNRVTYNRIDDTVTTQLTQPLNSYDEVIYVEDASGLPVPTPKTPGVIMIDAERIEYFVKNGNTLSQLRRGTYGTGVRKVYPVGVNVRDLSVAQQVPYKDEVVSTAPILADGESRMFETPFVPSVDSSTLNTSWYRSTIPANYGQSNDIEVFVGGRRLRKAPTVQWSVELGPESPVADVMLEAEFSVDGVTGEVRLTEIPPAGVFVQIQKRIGRLWAPIGVSLEDAETDPARFIRARTAYLPDTKYYEEGGVPSDTTLLAEDSTALLDETGNPLESE